MIKFCSTFALFQGYWRLAKVKVACNIMRHAVDIYLDCCDRCLQTMEEDDLTETIKEIIVNSLKVSGKQN